MATGYQFQGAGATKDVRQFINLDSIWNQRGGSAGMIAEIHVAQDDKEIDEIQADTRLQYDVYDTELAEATDNLRGVDNTLAISEEQWQNIIGNGDIVKGEPYQHFDRHTGRIDTKTPEYLTYQSDLVLTNSGAELVTDSIKAMDQPFDVDKHSELTVAKINENSPAEQARRMVMSRKQERSDTFIDLEDDLEL